MTLSSLIASASPDHPPLVLTQAFGSGGVRIPTVPQTIGDHLRKRRLGLKMLQREVAGQIGVDPTSVFNWEANTSRPDLKYMPAVISFIGYNPPPEGRTLGERLVRRRTALGLSQKDTAVICEVDPCTLARWERDEREPKGASLNCVKEFLDE